MCSRKTGFDCLGTFCLSPWLPRYSLFLIAIDLAPRSIIFGRFVQARRLSVLPLLVQFIQKWHAPMATSSRAKAIGELARNARLFTFKKCIEFAQAHSKTQTNMIVRIHHSTLGAVFDVSCLPMTTQYETQYGATNVPERFHEPSVSCSAENSRHGSMLPTSWKIVPFGLD